MKLKNKIIILIILAFSFMLISSSTFASNTNGTIDSIYHYAWGENVGFIDIKNITITDTSLGGSAYGENIGFIDLSTVNNNNEGTLSGHAWGENIGWVDFQGVVINNHGVFTGQAYGENIGFITFNTNDNNKVKTDWRPRSTRSSHLSGSGRVRPITAIHTPPLTNCLPGYLFDTNTGKPCTVIIPITDTIITRNLKLTTPRMQGKDVEDLQNYLNIHNYNTGIPDGIFGKLTRQAVIDFQKANQLKVDGIVGRLTKSKLK